jgi:hypothetical protein
MEIYLPDLKQIEKLFPDGYLVKDVLRQLILL